MLLVSFIPCKSFVSCRIDYGIFACNNKWNDIVKMSYLSFVKNVLFIRILGKREHFMLKYYYDRFWLGKLIMKFLIRVGIYQNKSFDSRWGCKSLFSFLTDFIIGGHKFIRYILNFALQYSEIINSVFVWQDCPSRQPL